MRPILAIGMLTIVGCTPTIVIEDVENECEVTETVNNSQVNGNYSETYQCTGEEVKEYHRFFSQDTDMAMIAIEGPL